MPDLDRRQAAKIAELFTSPNTTAIVLCYLLNDRFGDEFYLWEPTTIYLEIRDEWHIDPHPVCMDRISAGQVVMTTGAFFEDIGAFMAICNTFAGGAPAFTIQDRVEPHEIAWTIAEVGMFRDFRPFAPTIKDFVRLTLKLDGYGDDYPEIYDEVLKGKRVPPRQVLGETRKHWSVKDETESILQFVTDLSLLTAEQFASIGRQDLLRKMLDGMSLDRLVR